jgi:hypothetical protein
MGCAADFEAERRFSFYGGADLSNRASFDLQCPIAQLEAQVLQRMGMAEVADSVGVRGCGHQATYTRDRGNHWILNSPIMASN